jgi:hypothetical protein
MFENGEVKDEGAEEGGEDDDDVRDEECEELGVDEVFE